jgi:hypothetical protein
MYGVLMLVYLHCMYEMLVLGCDVVFMNAIDGVPFECTEEPLPEDPEQQLDFQQGKYNMSLYPKHC